MTRQLAYLLRLPRRLLMLLVFNTKWDAFLTFVPGVLILATGVRQVKDTDASQNLFILTYEGHSWLKIIPSALVLTGSVMIFLGIFRFFVIELENKINLLLYLSVQCSFVCLYMLLSIFSWSSFNQISTNLSESMGRQLVLSQQTDSLFSSSLLENWDQMQIMSRCCGVGNYRDYTGLPSHQKVQSPIPTSCCVLKPGTTIKPENFAQCQADARNSVRDSVFIHTRGCLDPMLMWLEMYVFVPQAVLWGSILSQAFAAAQGFWVYQTIHKSGQSRL